MQQDYQKLNDERCKVKSVLEYSLKLMNRRKISNTGHKVIIFFTTTAGKWLFITRIWNRVINVGTGPGYKSLTTDCKRNLLQSESFSTLSLE